MTENELAGMHHHLDGHEFEQALKIGQRSLVCCSPWGHKESDTTEQLNNNKHIQATNHVFLSIGGIDDIYHFRLKYSEVA